MTLRVTLPVTVPVTLAAYARFWLEVMRQRGRQVAVAESDTGGLVLATLVAVPGSSAVVLGGVVAYSDRLKQSLLGVAPEVIAAYGAVSAEVATAMAEGMVARAGADLGLATTGISGPSGARPGKPVGLAYVAVARRAPDCEPGAGGAARTEVREYHWSGDRTANQAATARAVLELALDIVQTDT